MKTLIIAITTLFLCACAHNNTPEKTKTGEVVCKEFPCKDKDQEIKRLTAENSKLKQDAQKVCWRAIKKTCSTDFKCVERGVKTCESMKNEK